MDHSSCNHNIYETYNLHPIWEKNWAILAMEIFSPVDPQGNTIYMSPNNLAHIYAPTPNSYDLFIRYKPW